MKRILTLALVLILSTSCLAQQHPGAEEFAAKAASESGLDQAEVLQLLQNARFKQSIVDAMTRPAEAKPWHEYRPIFITDKRINGGVAFWRENEALVSKAAEAVWCRSPDHRGDYWRGNVLWPHHRQLPRPRRTGHAVFLLS